MALAAIIPHLSTVPDLFISSLIENMRSNGFRRDQYELYSLAKTHPHFSADQLTKLADQLIQILQENSDTYRTEVAITALCKIATALPDTKLNSVLAILVAMLDDKCSREFPHVLVNELTELACNLPDSGRNYLVEQLILIMKNEKCLQYRRRASALLVGIAPYLPEVPAPLVTAVFTGLTSEQYHIHKDAIEHLPKLIPRLPVETLNKFALTMIARQASLSFLPQIAPYISKKMRSHVVAELTKWLAGENPHIRTLLILIEIAPDTPIALPGPVINELLSRLSGPGFHDKAAVLKRLIKLAPYLPSRVCDSVVLSITSVLNDGSPGHELAINAVQALIKVAPYTSVMFAIPDELIASLLSYGEYCAAEDALATLLPRFSLAQQSMIMRSDGKSARAHLLKLSCLVIHGPCAASLAPVAAQASVNGVFASDGGGSKESVVLDERWKKLKIILTSPLLAFNQEKILQDLLHDTSVQEIGAEGEIYKQILHSCIDLAVDHALGFVQEDQMHLLNAIKLKLTTGPAPDDLVEFTHEVAALVESHKVRRGGWLTSEHITVVRSLAIAEKLGSITQMLAFNSQNKTNCKFYSFNAS